MNLPTKLDPHAVTSGGAGFGPRSPDAAAVRSFLRTRCVVVLAVLAATPLCLAFGVAAGPWQTAALAWLSLHPVAVAVVSRSGRIEAGVTLCVAAWVGLSATLALGSGSPLWLALVLLAQLEAASISASVLGLLIRLGSGAIGVVLALWLCGHAAPPAGVFGAVTIAATLGYGSWLAWIDNRSSATRERRSELVEERFRLLSEFVDDLLLCFDRTGSVVSASAAAERLFHVKPRDLVGRGFFEHVHVADRPAFLKLVTDVAAASLPGTATLRLRTGTMQSSPRGFDEPVFAWVELRARPAAENEGRTESVREAAVLALVRDVTTLKHQEAALDEARRATERSYAGRDLILANISHELRTPLNAIIGFAEILASEALVPQDAAKRREYAGIINQSGQHLLAVVNSILDASKIESGSFAIAADAFDVADLVASCCDMVGLRAEQSSIRLVRQVAPVLPDMVADMRACRQILLNLLSNAIKFTPPRGLITVGARLEGNSMLLSVADTGIGIGVGDLPRLGDPFFQAQSSYSRPYDGTGLGLSVVRGLVGLHGGKISIESASGQGTCVIVRLPIDCRRAIETANGVTKIETIPRYPSVMPSSAEAPELARVHKIA